MRGRKKMNDLNLPVEEFTTPNPVTANENDSVEILSNLMNKHGIRHLPIMRNEQVVGVISERDLKIIHGLEMHEKSELLAKDIWQPSP